MNLDGQKTRSLATQQALMKATELLVAKKGIQNISIKEIVTVAGQKNESALQYHFGNLQGLISAIHAARNQQIQEMRGKQLSDLVSCQVNPTLRELCRLMVLPTFELAKSDSRFKRYVASFSHELALTEDSALTKASKSGGGGESGQKIGELLRTALPHLDELTYRRRMDLAVRMCSIAMGNHARQKSAFKEPEAGMFLSNLIDAMEGLLTAPVSEETKAKSDLLISR